MTDPEARKEAEDFLREFVLVPTDYQVQRLKYLLLRMYHSGAIDALDDALRMQKAHT